MSTMYEKMKARGINMAWYERGKHRRSSTAIPLEDEQCYGGSIYLLKQSGELWTIAVNDVAVPTQVTPHSKVRDTGKELPHDILVCMHCKKQWQPRDINEARAHRA